MIRNIAFHITAGPRVSPLSNGFQKDPRHRTSDLAIERIHPRLNPLKILLYDALSFCHASDQNHTT